LSAAAAPTPASETILPSVNFPVLLHLLRTDWLRLKRPVIVLWLLVIFTALPWLLHDPGSFHVPAMDGTGSSDLVTSQREMWGNPWIRRLLAALQTASSVLAFGIACSIGLQWKRRPAIPISLPQQLAAALLAFLLFIVLPVTLLIALNLGAHGFSAGIVMQAAWHHAVALSLLLAMAGLFAAWCRSWWWLSVGIVSLIAAGTMLESQSSPLRWLLPQAIAGGLWLPQGISESWQASLLATLCLMALFPLFHNRVQAIGRIATAVALVLASAWLGSWTLAFSTIPTALPTIAATSFEPLIQQAEARTAGSGSDFLSHAARRPPITQVVAKLHVPDLPADQFIEWTAQAPATLSRDGAVLATLLPPERRRAAGRPPEAPVDGADFDQAIRAVLPATLVRRDFGRSPIGSFELSDQHLSDGLMTIRAMLSGVVYRVETVFDVPLDDNVATIEDGAITWRIRRFIADDEKPWADIALSFPAPASASPARQCRFFIYRPELGICEPVQRRGLEQAAPLLAGAGWHRQLLRAEQWQPQRPPAWQKGEKARLIAVRPVAVGRIPARAVTAGVRHRNQAGDPSAGLQGDSRAKARSFVDPARLDARPDPESCTAAEFGRWLRIPALMHSSRSTPWRDLAEYAPRFSGLMARAPTYETLNLALQRGTPHSQRHDVIGQLHSHRSPDRIARVASQRGWTGEIADELVALFHQGYDAPAMVTAVLSLERPDTYPGLIALLMRNPNLPLYERIRQLPGIAPLLTEAVTANYEASPKELPAAGALGAFTDGHAKAWLIPAKEGNAEAFRLFHTYLATLLRRGEFPNESYNTELLTPTAEHGTWIKLYRETSPENFRYDPLRRVWNDAK
jgi:hypothetical protein